MHKGYCNLFPLIADLTEVECRFFPNYETERIRWMKIPMEIV